MGELSPLDAAFLELEDADTHVSAGLGAVAILAGRPGDRTEFATHLSRLTDLDPRLRQKIRRDRWNLTAPRWVVDPDFSVQRHIRWTALPEPCDDHALWELVATTMEQRLDRDHPLWQFTVVERLAGDRWALVLSAHHSMLDGVSGIALLQRLCDADTPAHRRGIGRRHDPPGRSTRRLVRSLAAVPARSAELVADTARGALPLLWNVVAPADESSLNGPIGHRRRYAVARVSLSEARRIAREYDATINDVALTAVATAFRTVLTARGESPRPHSVRVLAPVSVRVPGEDGDLDNRLSAMLPLLPVDLADPGDQLRAVRERMRERKAGGESSGAASVVAMSRLVPFAPVGWSLRWALRFPQRGVAALATNVPGPRRTLSLRGQEILDILPYAPIAMRLRFGIAILSYRDTLGFGVTGDYDGAPDTALFARALEEAVARLAA